MSTLRERKAAQTRVAFLNAALELAGSGPAEAVTIEAICERVGVSKVTFFNYFPRREMLALFFAWTGWLRGTIELATEPVRGVAALRRTFRRSAALFSEWPGFTLAFVGYVAGMGDMGAELEAFRPTAAEKQLLHPDVPGVGALDILRLDQQWVRHIQEAIVLGELPAATVPGEMVMQLGTVLYGVPVMAAVSRQSRIEATYDTVLDRVLGVSRGV